MAGARLNRVMTVVAPLAIQAEELAEAPMMAVIITVVEAMMAAATVN